MRDALIIFFGIIIALLVGAYLFFNGKPTLQQVAQPAPVSLSQDAPVLVLQEGTAAVGVDRRTNYRITNDEDFIALWSLVNGAGGPARPHIDFDKYEVIGVFDGSHSTGGYSVKITGIQDVDGKRIIYIERGTPGEDCVTTQEFSSPFQLVRVPKTLLPVTREETEVTATCS